MKRWISLKRIMLIMSDAILINIAFVLAYFFRYEGLAVENIIDHYIYEALIITVIYLLAFYFFSLYKRVWIYAGITEIIKGITACVVGGIVSLFHQFFAQSVPFTIIIFATILISIFVIGVRLSYRIYTQIRISMTSNDKKAQRVMIIGAGEAGSIAIREMRNNQTTNLCPVCIIDDDKSRIGTILLGIPVVGDRHSIEQIAKIKNIDLILIAIPSIMGKNKQELIQICKNTNCQIKTMPSIYEIISGEVSINKIRNIKTEELLGRTPIKLDSEKIGKYLEGKKVLVTGAAGVIGGELAHQIAKYNPSQLLLIDINENNMYNTRLKLQTEFPNIEIKGVVLSIKDRNGVENLFRQYHPQIVFHAAAHNQIHLMESSPAEAIKNNVFGTLNVAETADQMHAEQFIFISMDKAANPNNIVGATKRISEMIIQSLDKRSQTKFSSIRFGNIIENSNSYVSKFKKQIEHSGPVTVEHKEMTRYFMTIPEVEKLILQASSFAIGGEIFVLDMGSPVRIYDLAKDIIKLSGYEVDKDIEIQITGMTEGQEIFEEVLTDEEGLNETEHELIYTGRSAFDNYVELKEKLDNLKMVLDKGSNAIVTDKVIQTVKDLLPNYYSLSFEETITSLAEIEGSKSKELQGKKRIFLASPHMSGLEQLYIKEAFDTNWIAPLGPNVDEFEKEVESYVDIKAAAATVTGTSAIHMALKSLGVGTNDLVFCSSLTFSASCNPIIYQGAIPVFIDSEMESWNMSPIALQSAFDACIEKSTLPKAIIVVNLYGQSADYDAIKKISDFYEVPIVEDAAESIGATYKDKFTGTFGDFGIFSFNGNKIITTSGGGMLISNDEVAIKKVKFTITQARDQARHYQHSELGYNYRMSNVLAGIGRGQLKILKDRIAQKKAIYNYYSKAFTEIQDIQMMPVAPFGKPNYWLSVITLNENSKVKPLDIMIALEKENIESRPVWKPMHLQPYFMKCDFYSHNKDGISVSEDLFNRGVCLPSDTKMTENELERTVEIVRNLFN